MCAVLLPPGDNPIAVNKYIISSYQNSKNEVLKNPHALHKNPLHSSKIGVRCSVMGPLLFGQPITAENNLNVLTQFIALVERMNESECWFQPDGMPAHMAKKTDFSHDFHDHIFGHILWLLWSPY
jgi:hypothetical protein